jgi:pimeloyl-ACP methyl ester carboxylesterase
MRTEQGLAAALTGFVHRDGRLAERFVDLEIEGTRTIGVLASSPDAFDSMGWVICHSFGMEQLYLQPLEVAAARALAAAGFSVLRYHARGYGDSESPTQDVTVASGVQDAVAASSLLREAAGVADVGFLGARFGGVTAALAADRLRARAMVLWEPLLDGKRYLQGLARLAVATELASRGRAAGSAREPEDILRERGVLDLQGFPVGRRLFEEVSAIRLVSELRRFGGSSLVVEVTRGTSPSRRLEPLVNRLRELGGDSRLELVTDPDAPMFGQQRYRLNGAGHKTDRQGPLSAALIECTVGWASRFADHRAVSASETVP